jgi:hypothetical protein
MTFCHDLIYNGHSGHGLFVITLSIMDTVANGLFVITLSIMDTVAIGLSVITLSIMDTQNMAILS